MGDGESRGLTGQVTVLVPGIGTLPYGKMLENSGQKKILLAPRAEWGNIAVADNRLQQPTIGLAPERWLSGRKQRFAKPSYGSYRTPGSNPGLSAIFFLFFKPRSTRTTRIFFGEMVWVFLVPFLRVVCG